MAAAKLLLPQETFTDAGLSQYAKDKLNEHLPEDVQCFSVSKVPKSFRGRDECTLRCGKGRKEVEGEGVPGGGVFWEARFAYVLGERA